MARGAQNKVDPDLGLSPAQQQKRWNEIFNSVRSQTEVSSKTSTAKRKVGVRQPKSDNQLKGKAIEMFKSGSSVKDVSSELSISYANAYYYSKFAK